ncbi:hypothetical protein MVLG_02646 [Microbotryum lychnidis-dioicae p1A1 Lamole]|uniref:Uncharacterized protein n=1 Tax=Microbotryum lychnidis-dioicae (strain p1A1 Lamole / MvSl-1064) TaxID=683840 RepID=U5H5T1_USTV1|nr:hypothetical protein MVLG_02646 [Microbotryum lychnidis-dioicae p1A1 Lamole]|eukprot:KDE07070.1 hypothetical protein MVLG_02646 [Microbotryum lychnidis-dioicae p1A1 Lamole]
MPEPSAPTRSKGIPLRVLINRRECFFPDMMFRFFEYAGRRPKARFYKEAEIIWQAVSEKTWRELEAYSKALLDYCVEIETRLEQRSGWNIFSPQVWAARLELMKFYYGERGLCNDYWKVIRYSGYGSLPSFRSDRVAYFSFPDPRPSGPSGFLEGEQEHLKKHGGIVFDGTSTGLPTDFDVVVDARSNFLPKDDEILGIAALLPGPESESRKTDSERLARFEGD